MTPACENGFSNVSETALDQNHEESGELRLDERFRELRAAVDVELSRSRNNVIAELARAVTRMRSAADEAEWRDAVLECGRKFSNHPEALELIASVAALSAQARAAAVKDPAATADRISAAAQRFARVRIAEIQLYYAGAVKAGRAGRNLYGTLRPHIEAARDAFRDRFLKNGNPPRDYLHAEIMHALANDDATLLGPDYPGALV